MNYPDIDLEVLPSGHFKLFNFNGGDNYTATTIAVFPVGKPPCIYEIHKGDITPTFHSDQGNMAVWTDTSITIDMDYLADIYVVAWDWGSGNEDHKQFAERTVISRSDLENRVAGRMARKAARNSA